jgi:nucleoid-associated protein YgaU
MARGSPQMWTSHVRAETPAYSFDSAQSLILVLTLCVALFTLATWVRDSITPTSAASATITVHPGDTVWAIAQKYGDPDRYILERVSDIIRINGLTNDHHLQIGETLVVPTGRTDSGLYCEAKYASRQAP